MAQYYVTDFYAELSENIIRYQTQICKLKRPIPDIIDCLACLRRLESKQRILISRGAVKRVQGPPLPKEVFSEVFLCFSPNERLPKYEKDGGPPTYEEAMRDREEEGEEEEEEEEEVEEEEEEEKGRDEDCVFLREVVVIDSDSEGETEEEEGVDGEESSE